MQPQDTTEPIFIKLPMNATDITNQRFGRLVALGVVHSKNGRTKWLCACDCGNKAVVRGASLRDKTTKSCGCLSRDLTTQRFTMHGMSREPIYAVWEAMIQRCTNPNAKEYPRYGGRGITICDEWKNSFESFHAHVSQLPGFKIKSMSIDRIDNNSGYFPGNVRWATPSEQSHNSRNVTLYTHNGKTQCITTWAKELNINVGTLGYRLRHWSAKRALTTTVRNRYLSHHANE